MRRMVPTKGLQVLDAMERTDQNTLTINTDVVVNGTLQTEVSGDYSWHFINGYEDESCYVRIYKENNELKIIVSGLVNIDQSEFTVGAVQTPISFELPEEVSRKLYVGNSNTAAGNVCAMPGLYYNDITYETTVVGYIIKRVEENGNIYQIRYTGCELTNQSAITDLNWRITLAL